MSLHCNAGNTAQLMQAVYAKKSALVEDKTFLKDATAGLGIMKYDDIYSLMSEVVSKVLKSSNLVDFKNTLLVLGSSVGGMQKM